MGVSRAEAIPDSYRGGVSREDISKNQFAFPGRIKWSGRKKFFLWMKIDLNLV
jgi:hypothetical protein